MCLFKLLFKHENLLLVLLKICLWFSVSLWQIYWFFPFLSFLLISTYFYSFQLIFTHFYLILPTFNNLFILVFTYFYSSIWLISTCFYLFLLILTCFHRNNWILVLTSWIPASKNFMFELITYFILGKFYDNHHTLAQRAIAKYVWPINTTRVCNSPSLRDQ